MILFFLWIIGGELFILLTRWKFPNFYQRYLNQDTEALIYSMLSGVFFAVVLFIVLKSLFLDEVLFWITFIMCLLSICVDVMLHRYDKIKK
jgi:hypothetical protein